MIQARIADHTDISKDAYGAGFQLGLRAKQDTVKKVQAAQLLPLPQTLSPGDQLSAGIWLTPSLITVMNNGGFAWFAAIEISQVRFSVIYDYVNMT